MRGRVPHLEIAGVTGSGKSEFLKWLLYVLCNQQPPWRLDIRILDLKDGATFSAWAHLPHVTAIHDDTDSAIKELHSILGEMHERLGQIRRARYKFQELPQFQELILVIDEGGELSPADADGDEAKKRKEAMHLLSQIVRIGREAQLHVIYSTQRPDKDTLPLRIRSQLEARFAFRVAEDYDSKIVLRHEGAEQLPLYPGRMIYQTPSFEEEVQATYAPDEFIQAWLMKWARIIDVDGHEESIADKVTPDSNSAVTLSSLDTRDFRGV